MKFKQSETKWNIFSLSLEEQLNLLLLPVIVVELVDVDVVADAVAVAVELVVDGEALELTVGPPAPRLLDGEAGSDMGDDGGDCFISSNNDGDLLVAFAFGAPFNAELLANCK